ncbi:MAG: AEC family transporter [Chromatiales bacterium]|jgi:predicted permease|nr:AEC family transporter [Chromatiales bacterium]MDX9766736.1 AEC family transporter [Ectothiorhodospiraceae bacterium]
MFSVTTQMAALIACGVLWRLLRPGDLDAEHTRRVLTTVVYYLLLPCLVLVVLWRAPLGTDSLRIAAIAAAGVLMGMTLAWGAARLIAAGGAVAGAMILAAGFPNATYMGLPVLENLFGETGRSIAIQYDLFACTPLLLSVGVLVAQRHGSAEREVHPLQDLLRVPPLWAAALGVGLNLGGVPLMPWLEGLLSMLGGSVTPLMLFSLGLALCFRAWRSDYVAALLPIIAIQLMLMPLLALGLASGWGLSGDTLRGVVLEAAMPSMVLGLVFCDRFGLDTPLYAAAVTITTALALVTLPLWFGWVG